MKLHTNSWPAWFADIRMPVIRLLACLLAPVFAVNASISGPSALLYGTVSVAGKTITAKDTSLVVEARHTLGGPVLASYRMGDDPNAGDYYLLRIPMDEIAPAVDGTRAVAGDNLLILLRNSTGIVDQRSVAIAERGAAARADFGNPDADANGITDSWEIKYFGHAGIDPTADPDHDGVDNLHEFLNGTNPLLADARHPADNNPADNVLSITEVTAYGFAWQTGQPWPIAPTNIPIDFVTRAGLLWKGGERYKQDLTLSASAPLWWTNDLAGVPAGSEPRGKLKSLDGTTDGAVVRELPPAFEPGRDFVVRIDINPGSTVAAYAIEESLPEGWEASEIDGGGTFTSAQGRVRWGPYFDRQPRSVTYSVHPPAAVDRAVFQGVASFDGVSSAIDGVADVWRQGVVPRFTSLPVIEDGNLVLRTFGIPGQEYLMEASTDLENWSEVGRGLAGTQGEWVWAESYSSVIPARFYRSRPVHAP